MYTKIGVGAIVVLGVLMAMLPLPGQGQNLDLTQLLNTFQNLPQEQQNQLISQIAGQISGTGTTTGDTRTTTTTGETVEGLPSPRQSINLARTNSPGSLVRAALSGVVDTANIQTSQRQDYLDYAADVWRTATQGFISFLITGFYTVLEQEIMRWLGITVPTPTPTPSPTPTPTVTPSPTPTILPQLTPTPTPFL